MAVIYQDALQDFPLSASEKLLLRALGDSEPPPPITFAFDYHHPKQVVQTGDSLVVYLYYGFLPIRPFPDYVVYTMELSLVQRLLVDGVQAGASNAALVDLTGSNQTPLTINRRAYPTTTTLSTTIVQVAAKHPTWNLPNVSGYTAFRTTVLNTSTATTPTEYETITSINGKLTIV